MVGECPILLSDLICSYVYLIEVNFAFTFFVCVQFLTMELLFFRTAVLNHHCFVEISTVEKQFIDIIHQFNEHRLS